LGHILISIFKLYVNFLTILRVNGDKPNETDVRNIAAMTEGVTDGLENRVL
jgi:hypothetical protein